MTDATAFVEEHGHVEANTVEHRLNRPARTDEIKMVHAHLMDAIAASEFYSDAFKSYESRRLTTGYLRDLMSIDPRHVLMVLSKGEPIGFQITGPELGTLWLYWSYMFPEARKHVNPIRFLPALAELWDNDRYHKIATYTRPTNKVATILCRRAKFEHIATIENHIFGEDYMLFERPLTKAIDSYDHGAGLGFVKRMKHRMLAALGR